MRQEVVIDIRGQNVSVETQSRIRREIASRSGGIIDPDTIRFRTSNLQ